MSDDIDARMTRTLSQFGFDSFLPGQEAAVRALLVRRDVLAVLPTGSGKSLIYQLASQLLPGVTVVVSPLIALMKDQVESLEERGVAAGAVNSSVPEGEVREEMMEVRREETRLLFVAPERFRDAEFVRQLQRIGVSLLAVDEAHCISEWGHDFRPAYLGLERAIRELGRPTILALTATATPWVREEITDRLGMRDPLLVVRGVDRPNLFLEAVRVEEEDEDYAVLRRLLVADGDKYPEALQESMDGTMKGSGIVYVRTTSAAEETAGWLAEWGIEADYYHGRRRRADRERVQDQFMSGELRVIAATNAFGLGVDKPDVRFVIHRDVPASLEGYYQEAGRAGRDGEFARCTIVYRPGDLDRAAFLARSGRVTRAEVGRVRDVLAGRGSVSYDELADQSGVGRGKLGPVVAFLTRSQIVEESGDYLQLRGDLDVRRVARTVEEQRRSHEGGRIAMMRSYAETIECRRGFILNYFGEETADVRCDLCDNDVMAKELLDASHEVPGRSHFSTGDAVIHERWGEGVVRRVAPGGVTIAFETAGYKMLDPETALEAGILRKKGETF